MIANRMKRTLSLAVVTAMIVMLAGVSGAHAATAPIKEIISSHLGWEVDKKTKARICTVASKHECQPGKPNSQPGGFEHPVEVAGAPNGSVYVADRGNHRVQELTATGEFVLMFGKEVNKKGGDVCTAAEESECQTGVEGSAPGQFGETLNGLAVDPVSGDVYVADRAHSTFGERIQKFTPDGRLILEIGKEVNETKLNAVKAKGGTPTQKELEEENLCTQEEVKTKGVKCTGPAPRTFGVTPKAEPGAFAEIGAIAVGGPEDRLYVGEQNHVQGFNPAGESVSEPAEAISARLMTISPGTVSQIAVNNSCSLHKPALTESTTPTCKEFDSSYGDVYLTYQVNLTTNVIRRFDSSGNETELPVSPRTEDAGSSVQYIAVDPAGRLAVIDGEISLTSSIPRAAVYEVGTGGLHLITEFAITSYPFYNASSIAFNGNGDLYVASQQPGHEVAAYVPVPVGELVAGSSPSSCQEGAEHETDATIDCGLTGQVDPWGVLQTEVWFEWGTSPSLGEKTTPQPIKSEKNEGEEEPKTNVSATLEGLRPNETLYYQVAGEDQNVKAPELLTSERMFSETPTVPPRIVGEPSVSYVHSSSAVMFGRLNPENTPTRYAFQYAQSEACKTLEESCPGLAETKALEGPDYGPIATTLEATGLQPATTYRYRLFAVNHALNKKDEAALNEKGGKEIPEGTFTTASAPVPQAATGAFSALSATSATISGTINPDAKPATYAFELGIYNGVGTQYGIVFSGPAGESSTPVEEQLALTGLQPGTTYAYRIKVSSGYGTAYGATETFTTAGLPSVLISPTPLALLAIPNIAFPKEPAAKVIPKKLTRAQQLARALKACAKQPKSKRAACRRGARTKYAASKTKAKKK